MFLDRVVDCGKLEPLRVELWVREGCCNLKESHINHKYAVDMSRCQNVPWVLTGVALVSTLSRKAAGGQFASWSACMSELLVWSLVGLCTSGS